MKPIQTRITIAAGRIQSVEPQYGSVTIVSEQGEHHYPGAWVMPGFVDSHAHILGLGKKLMGLALYETTSAEECVERAQRHEQHKGSWLLGMGWNQENWGLKEYPTAQILDSAFPDTPVCLRRADGHAVWVNSAALHIAGITAQTKDPTGGKISRDTRGRPTGILIDNAMELVHRHIPEPTLEEKEAMILRAAWECARMGITEVHDMDVHPSLLPLYRNLAEKGALPIRIQSHISGQHDEWMQERLLPAGGEFFRVYAIKLYADGALGSRGALLLEPYEDAQNTRGLALLSEEEIEQKVRTILEFGWNVAVHAIGDAANRAVLNVYGNMRTQHIADEHTLLRIEHAQIVHPDDQEKFGRFSIIPAVQPIHCISDASMAQQRLGSRCSYAYPWRSLRNNGVCLAGGSDFPIESGDPLIGIDAFCRRIPFGQSGSWHHEQCITREESLEAYTTWAHNAADMGYRRGSVRPKYDADLVVLDTNILTCEDDAITKATVLATYSGGARRFAPGMEE